jgi:hypothetical protein
LGSYFDGRHGVGRQQLEAFRGDRIRPCGKAQTIHPADVDVVAGRCKQFLDGEGRQSQKIAAVKGDLHGVARLNPMRQKPIDIGPQRFGRRQSRGAAGDSRLVAEDTAMRTTGVGDKNRDNQRFLR